MELIPPDAIQRREAERIRELAHRFVEEARDLMGPHKARLPARSESGRMSLAVAPSRWQYKVWTLLRTGLEKLRRAMADVNPLCRRFLAARVVAMAVVLIGLSTVSRQPYTGTNSVSWHTSKASRMNLASRNVRSETQALRRESDSEPQPRSHSRVSFFAFELDAEEPFFILGVDKFRSPPTLS